MASTINFIALSSINHINFSSPPSSIVPEEHLLYYFRFNPFFLFSYSISSCKDKPLTRKFKKFREHKHLKDNVLPHVVQNKNNAKKKRYFKNEMKHVWGNSHSFFLDYQIILLRTLHKMLSTPA